MILLLATFLRVYQLDASSLWNDEGNSWAMLSRSFGEIAAAAALDIHPPGYYWLLKFWSMLFGASAASMRGLSALLGVLLVALIAGCAVQATRRHPAWGTFPVLAALLAALNPFQVYYSQEARMYMLLAVEAAGLFWALVWMAEGGTWRVGAAESERLATAPARALSGPRSPRSQFSHRLIPQLFFIFFGIAGLWTHYSFPIVLVAAGLAFLSWWAIWLRRAAPLLHFLALNCLILLAFLPWLPTAVDRVLNWPKGGAEISAADGLVVTLSTLLFGPLAYTPAPLWPWLLVAGVLPLIGLAALRRAPFAALSFGFWLFLPIVMMFGLGLFTDAFLKFLLVASPAWVLLVAAAPWIVEAALAGRAVLGHRVLWVVVACFGIGAALASLPTYYADAHARDNYQGIARYLSATGDPARDLVVLDAPGQQEVWRYYDPGLPVVALPTTRPAVRGEVEEMLAAAVAGKTRVFALFWATDEADPEQYVERWLDANGFKTLDSWQGNLRVVSYELAADLAPAAITPVRWENGMTLEGVDMRTPAPQRVMPGGAAIVRLRWFADMPMDARYKVSVQLLDARNQVIAQHDGEPGGGAQPTDSWIPGERIVDNHGVAIPFGTPPGLYQMNVVVYDGNTGARVMQSNQEMLPIGAVSVERADSPPLEVLPMQHRLDAALGPVQLVGYDAYRSGFAHAPETPVQPGDSIHFTLYWLAPAPLPDGWPADLSMTLRLGDQQLRVPLAGGAYPTQAWSAGELVRAGFELPYDGKSTRPVITVDAMSYELAPIAVE